METIIGIDLGTTNSAVGIMEAGLPFLLADVDGKRLTPSVVYFPEDNSTPLVGRPASRMRTLRPANTIYSVKRLIGAKSGAVLPVVSYATEMLKGDVQISVNGLTHSPEEISALILTKLKKDAETTLGQTVSKAVITVPAYFNDAQRAATKRAGEMAGLTVERILNEPTAAALAYGLDKLKDKSKIAVYDLGGGTFDISILELNQGVFEVLSTNGNTKLGGDDLDNLLMADCGLQMAEWEKRELVIQA